MFEHARPPCIIPILARNTGNDTQRSCICLNIEATVNIGSWSCGMFPRCTMIITRVLLLEITKSVICILHAHHCTLESLQDVYWGFKFDVVASYGWSLRASMNCRYIHILHGHSTSSSQGSQAVISLFLVLCLVCYYFIVDYPTMVQSQSIMHPINYPSPHYVFVYVLFPL